MERVRRPRQPARRGDDRGRRRAGNTVAIDLYNCGEYLETFYAALKIRAVPANVNYRYLDDEMRHLLAQAEARVLVHHATFASRVAPAIAALAGLRLVMG